MPFARFALHLLDRGYSPLPIVAGDKRPLLSRWDRLRAVPLTEAEIEDIGRRHPSAGLGIVGGYRGVVPVDIDVDDAHILEAIRRVLPELRVGKKGRRGETWLFCDPTGELRGCKVNGPMGHPIVEVLITGQVVVPPSVHPATGRRYSWLTRHDLIDTPADMLPIISAGHLADLHRAVRPWVPRPRPSHRPMVEQCSSSVTDARRAAYARAVLVSETRILAAMGPNTGRNRKLFDVCARVGGSVAHGHLKLSEVYAAMLRACGANGLLAEDGERRCIESMMSGIRAAQGDPLPDLPHRPV